MKTAVIIVLVVFFAGCNRSGVPVLLDDAGVVPDGIAVRDGVGPDTSQGQDSIEPDVTATDTSPDALPDTSPDTEPGPDIIQDTSSPPAGCCETAGDCDDGQVCVNTAGAAFGACLAPASEWQCWSDDDCGTDAPCLAKTPDYQPLAVACGQVLDEPGYCKGLFSYCCWADSDCPQTQVGPALFCIGLGVDLYGGVCVPAPVEGQCYTDSDCDESMECQGGYYCPCGMDCLPGLGGPGECVYPVNACGDGPVDATGLGTPCPNGNSDCEGIETSMCSSGVSSDPNLPPICTRYCNTLTPCGEQAFCIDWGYSSSCIPNDCKQEFLASCTSGSQCKIATKYDVCCPCAAPYTTAEIAADPCIFEGSAWPPPNPDCMGEDCDDFCEPCALPAAADCQNNKCVSIWDEV